MVQLMDEMKLLEGKVALITGAARGQGRAHALTCAAHGAAVIATDTSAKLETVPYETATAADLAETVAQVEMSGGRALGLEVDVRSQEQLDHAVARGVAEFGQVDILIANAGIWTLAPFWELSDVGWGEMIDINLSGVWKSAKAVAPHMISRRTGSIVLTSSVNGFEPAVDFAHYVASKHGVVGLMGCIALELAPHGVRCNAVNPGAVLTGMTDHQRAWDLFAGHEGGTRDDLIEGGYHYHALKGKSYLDPQAVADAALFLNSDLAANITGVALPVDAGHLVLPGFNHAPVR